jgi:hypothetical protein
MTPPASCSSVTILQAIPQPWGILVKEVFKTGLVVTFKKNNQLLFTKQCWSCIHYFFLKGKIENKSLIVLTQGTRGLLKDKPNCLLRS